MIGSRGTSLIAGVAAVAVALSPPVHDAATAHLSVHMIQHLVLILIGAPLVALGAPTRTIGRLVPRVARRVTARTLARPWCRRARDVARHPVLVWMLHVTVIWLWHLPVLYEAAVAHGALHVLEHAAFFASGVLFWSVVAHPGRAGSSILGGLVYVFAAGMQSAVLGALLVFADRAWYGSHVRTAGAALALADQQLAGALMWVPAGIVYLLAMLLIVRTCLGESPRRIATVLALVVAVGVVVGACRRPDEPPPPPKTLEGDPTRGAVAIERHGCGACHRIPGIKRARGVVGPPLDGFAARPFIAGALRNDPMNLVRWIRDPQAIEPGTVMPRLGVTEADARDIAAYLGRLR